MADSSIDVLMRIVGKNGPLNGEGRTEFTVNPIIDTLRRDFEPGKFSELRDFSFQAGVESALKKASKVEAARQKAKADKDLADERKRAVESGDKNRVKEIDDEAARKALSRGKLDPRLALLKSQTDKLRGRSKEEFVDMQPVEFTRIMDSSSTQLFTSLCGSETLPEVSIMKRKAGGVIASGLCYLRLDFKKVLLTDLTWKDDGHLIVETGKFIYRELLIRYRPQKPDGTLGPIIPGTWVMKSAR